MLRSRYLIITAAIALTASSWPVPAAAGEAEELLDETLEALGGRRALSELKTVVSIADVEMLGLGVTGTMESRRAFPCLYRSDISLGFFEVTQGYDGERMWRVDPNGMLTIIQDPESIRDRITTCLIDSYHYLLEEEGFRAALLATRGMPWDLLAVGTVSAVFVFVTGALYFKRMERIFADVA